MQHLYDDTPGQYLAKLPPGLVTVTCPDCQHRVHGKDSNHAAELLAIHREASCQGREEVSGDGDSDPAPDPQRAEDVLRLTPPPLDSRPGRWSER